MNAKIIIFSIIIILTGYSRLEALNVPSDLMAAKSAISGMKEPGYKGFLSVIDQWPASLDVLDQYSNLEDALLVREKLKGLFSDLADTTRQLGFSNNFENNKIKIEELIILHSEFNARRGYTNKLISSAVRTALRGGVFSTINRAQPDFILARGYLEKIKSSEGNFDIKAWLEASIAYDDWSRGHAGYIRDLPRYPAVLEIMFPLMKARETIPNRISHDKMLYIVGSLQLGICQYESDFFEAWVMPFWISYGEKEGLAKAGNLTIDDDVQSILRALPPHPFFGGDVTIQILNKFWGDSTGVEGIRSLSSTIAERSN